MSADTRKVYDPYYDPYYTPSIPRWPAAWEYRTAHCPGGWFCWSCAMPVLTERGIDGSTRRSCRCSVQRVDARRR